MLEHAVAWAREHQTGVAREVGSEFVAVLPDGRHSRHARFHEALAWLEAHGSTADQRRSGVIRARAPSARARASSDERISSRRRMNSFGQPVVEPDEQLDRG